MILFTTIILATVLAMEGVAWLMHKYLMHGPLWVLHESHHRRREGAFELNDAFGIFFAVPSMVLIWFGVRGHPVLLAIGIGMTAYGALYFFFHDVLVHRRLKLPFVPKGGYLHRVVRAHLIHHRTTTKEGAVSFGFLFAGDPDKLKARMDANKAHLARESSARATITERRSRSAGRPYKPAAARDPESADVQDAGSAHMRDLDSADMRDLDSAVGATQARDTAAVSKGGGRP